MTKELGRDPSLKEWGTKHTLIMTSGPLQLHRRSNMLLCSTKNTKTLTKKSNYHLKPPCGRRFWMIEMLVSILNTNKYWADWIRTSTVQDPARPTYTRVSYQLENQHH